MRSAIVVTSLLMALATSAGAQDGLPLPRPRRRAPTTTTTTPTPTPMTRVPEARAKLAEARAALERFRGHAFSTDADCLATTERFRRALLESAALVADEPVAARAQVIDERNVLAIEASFIQQVSLEGLDETFDLLPRDEARALLDLRHLTPAQRQLLLAAFAQVHHLAGAYPRRRAIRSEDHAAVLTNISAFFQESQLRVARVEAEPPLRPYVPILMARHNQELAAVEGRTLCVQGQDHRLTGLAMPLTVPLLRETIGLAELLGR
jgi:hypothetical protein